MGEGFTERTTSRGRSQEGPNVPDPIFAILGTCTRDPNRDVLRRTSVILLEYLWKASTATQADSPKICPTFAQHLNCSPEPPTQIVG